MKTALLMSCAASALRLAPTMVLQPRRDLLAGGAAAAASTLLVPEALAKKPLCLPGTNSAKALGGPGYTIGILEHEQRCLAAQFEQTGLEMLGRALGDDPADRLGFGGELGRVGHGRLWRSRTARS